MELSSSPSSRPDVSLPTRCVRARVCVCVCVCGVAAGQVPSLLSRVMTLGVSPHMRSQSQELVDAISEATGLSSKGKEIPASSSTWLGRGWR